MKQKNHSGTKKRVEIRKSGKVMAQKAGKKHLLANKSKRQKKACSFGRHIDKANMKNLRRLLPGQVALHK